MIYENSQSYNRFRRFKSDDPKIDHRFKKNNYFAKHKRDEIIILVYSHYGDDQR